MTLHEELSYRWQLYQCSDEAVFDLYDKGWQSLYFWCDPTADSLHLGNFTIFMNAVQYMKRKNHLVLIVGGATGMIGDPGGRSSERNLLDKETFTHNVTAIERQVASILQNLKELSGEDFSFEVKNNADFYEGMWALDYLRDIGKHITVNQMMHKETVKRRLEDPDQSISYTEFSYMLLQGYDFVRLYQDKNVRLQICGSDQRGNGVTWLEMIRKMCDGAKDCYVTTSPLILDSTGKKFWKSEGNAIRLDSAKNSPYTVYQYFMNVTDGDVERFLKLFTLLSREEINQIVATHHWDSSSRTGQTALAYYVCATLFGREAADQARVVSAFMFGEEEKVWLFARLSDDEIEAICREVGSHTMSADEMVEGHHTVIDLLVDSGLAPSRGEAKKLVQSGAVVINEIKITDIGHTPAVSDWISGRYLLLRKGKKDWRVVKK